MKRARIITGFIVLAAYLMVTLHNIIPHSHFETGFSNHAEIGHGEHHGHSHHHHHDDRHASPDGNILDLLEHLFSGHDHSPVTDHRLVHIASDMRSTLAELELCVASIVVSILEWTSTDPDTANMAHCHTPPIYEQFFSAVTSLRGPPTLG